MKQTIQLGLSFTHLFWVLSIAQANSLTGVQTISPLVLRSQTLGQFFRYEPITQGDPIPDSMRFQISASSGVANLWGADQHYIIDGQISDDWIEGRFRLSQSWELGLGLGRKYVSFSQTDQITIKFHDIFGIPQEGRLKVDQDSTRIAIPEYGLEMTKEQIDQIWSQHGFAHLAYNLFNDQYWTNRFIAHYAQETSKESLIGVGSKSYGFQLVGTWTDQTLGFFSGLTWMRHEDRFRERSFWLRPYSESLLVGGSYQLTNESQLITQSLIHRPAFREFGQLSRSTYEVHLGTRIKWEQIGVQVAIIENVIWPYNTPDWGFNLLFSVFY